MQESNKKSGKLLTDYLVKLSQKSGSPYAVKIY